MKLGNFVNKWEVILLRKKKSVTYLKHNELCQYQLERGGGNSWYLKDIEIHWCLENGIARSYFCGKAEPARAGMAHSIVC